MQSSLSEEQIHLAARLYYLDGMSQSEVARLAKVSQAKVSRLLALARERGIVRISVAEYDSRHTELENRLRQTLGIHSAAVIKTMPGASEDETRRMVGHFGAAFVSSLIPERSTVALAGGRTMRELIVSLPEGQHRNLTILQAMGNIGPTVVSVDALELGRILSQHWSSSFMMLNTPALVPDHRTRDAFLALEPLKAVWQRYLSVDVALVGIGTLENSVFVERGILGADDVKQLADLGVVGEVFGRFFDAQGRECASQWKKRVISMELNQLKKIPQSIGIVAGADRASAICAAVRGGLLRTLVIDEAAARAIFDQF